MIYSCVTPCLNAEEHIEETMLSVLTQSVFQSRDSSLYYRIQDGGSSDGTIEIVKRLIEQFSDWDNIEVSFVSEKDSGMYDALAKGFERGVESDIYSYLNAGDFYAPQAFDIVAEIFTGNSIYFLTGLNVVYNERSHLVGCNLPFDYNKNLLLKGFYGSLLTHVQQESTFWGHSLHRTIDYSELRKFQFSGDYYLWTMFIRQAPLFIVNAWLGGFKKHHGQLSSRYKGQYSAEMSRISVRPSLADHLAAYMHKIARYLPVEAKRRLSKQTFFYDHEKGAYRLS